MTHPTPRTDALQARHAQESASLADFTLLRDQAVRQAIELLEHTRQLERENAELVGALRLVEMETRDGGQWTLREVNEQARAILAKVGK